MSRLEWNIPDDETARRGDEVAERVERRLDRRIDAYLDGELTAEEAATLLREISRHPVMFARLSKDQAWIDTLAALESETPDVTIDVLSRVGADSSMASRTSRVIRVVRRLSAAAAIMLAFSLTIMMRPEPEAPPLSPVSAPFADPMGVISPEETPEFSIFELVDHAVNEVRNIADQQPQVLPAVEYRRGPTEPSRIAPPSHRLLNDPLQSAPTRLELPADLDLSAVGPMGFV